MTVTIFFAGAAKGDRMQHRHVVTHHCRFTDHDGMRVVNHDTAADFGIRVDIDAEHFGDPHLHEIRQIAAVVFPQPMADAVGLHRLISLEEQQRLDEPQTGRIAVKHRCQIDTGGLAQIGLGRIGLIGDFTQDLLAHLA